MANVKISELSVATTPLTGAELVPVVQGNITKQTTVQNIVNKGVASVSATLPMTSSGGSNPVIAMPSASSVSDGYLTASYWNAFNAKQAQLVSGSNIKTLNGASLLGSGDISVGGVNSISSVSPISVTPGATPVVSIQLATDSQPGYLSASDHASFVSKVGSVVSTDGSVTVTGTTTVDLSVATAAATTNVICQIRNTTGATLAKGTAVYISGATGQIPTVSKAQANSDAASAQTLGLITADLANNANGYVTIIGLITNIDTSAYTDGQQLYLSPTTAGGLTATKPSAPNHLVYVAVVEYAHASQGKLFVKVQNGYELNEIHDVQITSPSNGQTILYDASTSLWKNANLTAGTGMSVTNGAGSVTLKVLPRNAQYSTYPGSWSSITSDQLNITDQNTNITIGADTGTGATLTNGQKFIFRIRAYASGTITVTFTTGVSYAFRSIGGISLSSISVAAGKTLYVGCIYNSQDLIWDVVASGVS